MSDDRDTPLCSGPICTSKRRCCVNRKCKENSEVAGDCLPERNTDPNKCLEKPDGLRVRGEGAPGGSDLGRHRVFREEETDGTLEKLKISLTGDRLTEALGSGYMVRRSFASGQPAGELRVVVQDRVTGEAGSVRLPIGKSAQ